MTFNLLLIVNLLLTGCDKNEQDITKKSISNIATKIPKLAKKSVLPITIIAYSADANDRINKIDDIESKSKLEVFNEVGSQMLEEEKKDFSEITQDLKTIYKFGVKPAIKEAKNSAEIFYEDTKPAVIKNYHKAEKITKEKWKEAKPVIEETFNNAKDSIKEWLK